MKSKHPNRDVVAVCVLLFATIAFFTFTAATTPSPSADLPGPQSNTAPEFTDPPTGKELFNRSCANCHGVDGKGVSVKQLGLETPPPDFTDCDFASREPDADWIAVAHQGGPIRGFSKEMPSFRDALSEGELKKIMNHIRTFCTDRDWPRGELNLPRPLVTEKAYPEDEIVFSSFIDMENNGAVMNELIYEQRFGTRNQIEFVLPIGFAEQGNGAWSGGYLGDVAIGVKRALYHNIRSGSILSFTGEVLLPSGDEQLGCGSGTTVLEPFFTYGQILPAGSFLQVQTGLEYPVIQDRGENEAFWRATLGKSFNPNPWGRTWSPMVEFLGASTLESGGEHQIDIAPQIQITLNTRQHVMINVGYRIPVDDPDRDSHLMVYILWDWFDGGFLEGW